MGLRRLLENSSGGQVFSAYVILAAAVGMSMYVGYGIGAKLIAGEHVTINGDGVGLLLITLAIIPPLVRFVRAR
jgi:hypothetical protein